MHLFSLNSNWPMKRKLWYALRYCSGEVAKAAVYHVVSESSVFEQRLT